MAKHRKTREEKIRSSLRLQKPVEDSSMQTTPPTHHHISYTLPTRSVGSRTPQVTGYSYEHISHDLTKTLFITATIIFAQIILFVLLQTK